MSVPTQKPKFELLFCKGDKNDQPYQAFSPVEHDIIVLQHDRKPRIARNASAADMIDVLSRSNMSYLRGRNEAYEDEAALILIRFEDDDPARGDSSLLDNDWSRLWPVFDSCCNDDADALDFASRLRQTDPHCHSSVSKNIKADGVPALECTKISYSFNCTEKHILLAHHFHKINGEIREMVRMVTYGCTQAKLEAALSKALQYLNLRPSQTDCDSPGEFDSSLTPTPHPKAIICSMLEYLETTCRTSLEGHRKLIADIEEDINAQRDPNSSIPKGQETNFLRLSETRIELGELRQKLQYMLSSIVSLQETEGLPRACKLQDPAHLKKATGNCNLDVDAAPEDRLLRQWWRQLREVKNRLSGLKIKCQQHKINIENLQERVKGILSIVSILLAERENDYSRQSDKRRQEILDNQLKAQKYQNRMLNYQNEMLRQQYLIASRAKRDNTVMKTIAVLTALFLPGTFIATVFSVPVFTWDKPSLFGPRFMIYWYFTAPITTVIVVGFSVWFAKMWWDDRQAEREVRGDGGGDGDGDGDGGC